MILIHGAFYDLYVMSKYLLPLVSFSYMELSMTFMLGIDLPNQEISGADLGILEGGSGIFKLTSTKTRGGG